ncbi:uncharacterized protein NECHADRAFT_75953 [Fusarium vanettenii 77-13-4]|uniref:Uncharacterized protein n=1 Tax=Fusarium vanettenii (strain ATCC MYA-4622 / CBS 123669 / FGSC 9596 / NRRL 45880 / 77-13-4) TaxID=660122 RepID=C7Z626_FUSV7|nr:uncharacterized protein NECHADRAFT_75953 [Fusarium vanettenii 77-13-4]EEU40053.1 predicted protein [Fusarium vanettenii 77-13-4]
MARAKTEKQWALTIASLVFRFYSHNKTKNLRQDMLARLRLIGDLTAISRYRTSPQTPASKALPLHPVKGKMDQEWASISVLTHPESVYRLFKHRREYSPLPPDYEWEEQKRRYSPYDLDMSHFQDPSLRHPFGYVFCHRGLYERASRRIDNSRSAVENGINENFFLHEVDAFMTSSMSNSFLAHDQTADRVTSKKGPWAAHRLEDILNTDLVARGVQLPENPDFGSSYLRTEDQVPGLEGTIWQERVKHSGRTLQIDLRDKDFARGIACYAFHLPKRPFRNKSHRETQHHTLAWEILGSTMLKGYNLHFDSFQNLFEMVKKEFAALDRKREFPEDEFTTNHLHQLPPLIMVFYSDPVVELAKKTPPNNCAEMSYKHIRDVFMKHVLSFIDIPTDNGVFNFILEITHSGLGLLYDKETGKARNPLTGDPLRDPQVIFDSMVDRAMIDVSLELRERNPKLLFSSCTRLPDVIIQDQRYKANHKTGKLVPWPDGEKGIAAQLRAIHGGLYPQSNMVVADNPVAEIAARTWIDEKSQSTLRREELLRVPYYEWLRRAGDDVFDAVCKLNDDFLPNKLGEPTDSIPDRPRVSLDLETIQSWLDNAHSNVSVSDDTETQGDHTDSEDEGTYRTHSETSRLNRLNRQLFFGESDQGSTLLLTVQLNKNIWGADINASVGWFGTPLSVACAKGHERIVRFLLDKGANPKVPMRTIHNAKITKILMNAGADVGDVPVRGVDKIINEDHVMG